MTEPSWEPEWPLDPSLLGTRGADRAAAIQRLRDRIARDETDLEAYHGLFALWQDNGELDRAFCVAGLLVAFGKASASQGRFYFRHRRPEVPEPWTPVGHELWDQCVIDPDADRRLGELFELIYHAAGPGLPLRELRELGVREDDLVPPGVPTGQLVRHVAADLLAIDPPPIYVHRTAAGMSLLPTMPPVLTVGRDLLADIDPLTLCFLAGKYLTYLHPTLVMAGLFDYRQLGLMVMGSVGFAAGEIDWKRRAKNLPSDARRQLVGFTDLLARTMSGGDRKELEVLVGLLQEGGGTVDVLQWHNHAELTSHRVGLLACGDVGVATALVQQLPVGTSLASRAERVRDLVRYATSERHLIAREMLGLAVDPDG